MSKTAPPLVLDASCLLASVFGEPGGELVRTLIDGAMISTANWSEFVQNGVELVKQGVHRGPHLVPTAGHARA